MKVGIGADFECVVVVVVVVEEVVVALLLVPESAAFWITGLITTAGVIVEVEVVEVVVELVEELVTIGVEFDRLAVVTIPTP